MCLPNKLEPFGLQTQKDAKNRKIEKEEKEESVKSRYEKVQYGDEQEKAIRERESWQTLREKPKMF